MTAPSAMAERIIVGKSTLASCGRSLLSSPKSRPDRSKVMPDWAPDWARRADRSMVDRSRPDMSRFEKSRPERSMPEKSRPDRSICIFEGSIWKAAESLDSSMVNREDMSKPPDWLF